MLIWASCAPDDERAAGSDPAASRADTAVAADEVGRKLGAKTVKATSDGHLKLLTWARQWDERNFAVEDCRHLTRRLESDLLAAGQRLLRVPPQLMAAERRGGRERGKSHPIDALAVARAVLRVQHRPPFSTASSDTSPQPNMNSSTTVAPRP